MKDNVILAFGDGKYVGRAIVTLASASMFDGADLSLFTVPDSRTQMLPHDISVVDASSVLKDFGYTAPMATFPFTFMKYPAVLWLLRQGYKRVLVLDSDCLVVNGLQELWRVVDAKGVAACRDRSINLQQQGASDIGPQQFCATLDTALSLSDRELVGRLSKLFGLVEDDLRDRPYINAGVTAWRGCSTITSMLGEAVPICLANLTWLQKLTFLDQDFINAVFAANNIKADVLDPMAFNFEFAFEQKTIFHWPGAAGPAITPLWLPHLIHIRKALHRLGLSYETIVESFVVDGRSTSDEAVPRFRRSLGRMIAT